MEKNGGKMKNHLLLLLFTYTLLFVTNAETTKAFLLSHDLTFRKKETSGLFTRACVRKCVSLCARLRCCVGVFFYSFETDALSIFYYSTSLPLKLSLRKADRTPRLRPSTRKRSWMQSLKPRMWRRKSRRMLSTRRWASSRRRSPPGRRSL